MFCSHCGSEISDRAVICVKCGVPTGAGAVPTAVVTNAAAKSRLAYILLGVFLGGLGIHNFYAGYTGKAVAQLLITIFTFWLVVPILAVWIWVIYEVITVKQDANGVPFQLS
jgi:TM2 domain-containing membrane protein YozV